MTIEFTKERLEEIADEHMRVIYPQEVGQMARELLALRSRDAGDDKEVTLLAVGLSNDMACGGIGVMNSILRLRDIAISRYFRNAIHLSRLGLFQ